MTSSWYIAAPQMNSLKTMVNDGPLRRQVIYNRGTE